MNNLDNAEKKYMEGTKFDNQAFNKDFEKYILDQKAKQIEEDNKKLKDMIKQEQTKKLYQMSVGDILVGIKDTWFGILDDVLAFRFSYDIFLKYNRLFFIGLTLIIIALLILLYNFVTNKSDDDTNDEKNRNIIEIHHIYKMDEKDKIDNIEKMPEKKMIKKITEANKNKVEQPNDQIEQPNNKIEKPNNKIEKPNNKIEQPDGNISQE
uniref:Uncharacterized protein n=1 Tax=viral metagenome TaxID=1070528 RepID=A0A6C0E9T1_9ZZZZ